MHKIYIENVTEEYDSSIEAFKIRNEMRSFRRRQFFKASAITFFLSMAIYLGFSAFVNMADSAKSEPKVVVTMTAVIFGYSLFMGSVFFYIALEKRYSPYRQYHVHSPDQYLLYKNKFSFSDECVFISGRHIPMCMLYQNIKIRCENEYYYILQDVKRIQDGHSRVQLQTAAFY